MDGKNEDTDITPHPHSRTSVRQHSSKWRNLKYLFSVQLPLALIPAKLVKADVVIRSNQFQLRQPRFPCASLIPSQCVPAQPHQFRCHIPADNRVSAFSEPLQPFRECTHMITSRHPFSRQGRKRMSLCPYQMAKTRCLFWGKMRIYLFGSTRTNAYSPCTVLPARHQ